MRVTPCHGTTQVRGRGIAAALALAAALLWWGSGRSTLVHAQSSFETPPVLLASELAPPYLLQGPGFTVDPQVPIVGMHSAFEIIPWGNGEARMQLMSGVLALFRSPS